MKKIIVAIDGHSSCGKSTMAKELARKVGYRYIDTGAMYRAVTLYCIRENLFKGEEPDVEELEKRIGRIHINFRFNTKTGVSETFLNGENVEKQIRTMEVAEKVSPVSTISFVRKAMVSLQQEMGKEKEIVMDGRDIGTVVFPDAELKIFITARPEVRAARRLKELEGKGEKISFKEVLENIEKRDFIDSTRKDSPLKKAEDALLLDNSNLSLEEQNTWLLKQFLEKINS